MKLEILDIKEDIKEDEKILEKIQKEMRVTRKYWIRSVGGFHEPDIFYP